MRYLYPARGEGRPPSIRSSGHTGRIRVKADRSVSRKHRSGQSSSSEYSNYYLHQNGGKYGDGGYSVITTQEVEDQSQFDRILALQDVSGITTINRMLLPNRLEGDGEIREAASRLHADLVFLYTFDTAYFKDDASKPLTVISLGLSPTRKITAITTVSALLLDTRTGFVYSAYEVTEREKTVSTSWGSIEAADRPRRETEARAFGKLIDEFVASWPTILNQQHNQG